HDFLLCFSAARNCRDGLWHLLIRTGRIESVSAGLLNAAFALTGNLSAPPRHNDVSDRPTCDAPLSPGNKLAAAGPVTARSRPLHQRFQPDFVRDTCGRCRIVSPWTFSLRRF